MKHILTVGLALCLQPALVMGQDSAHASEARIVAWLDYYFGVLPSSSPGQVGRRQFRIDSDTLYIESFDPLDRVTGAPFQSEHRIPLAAIGRVRTYRGKGADGQAGMTLEFIPGSSLSKHRSPKEKDLSARADVDPEGGVRSSDLGQRIAGRAPGVMVGSDNSPGGTSRMRVRGPASIFSAGTPLYLVDDVPVSNLNAINPEDIVSVEVLKDASATALYGMRGANGVVKVKTRKGEGKGSLPADVAQQKDLAFNLWVFGQKARELHQTGDARRLADLLEYRATLCGHRGD